jgi:hypothetical protein
MSSCNASGGCLTRSRGRQAVMPLCEVLFSYPEVSVMARQEFEYRQFQFIATITPGKGNHAQVMVDVTTSDSARIADLGTDRFLHLARWVENDDPAFLQVVVDECKVAVDHYADNVDDS